MKIEKERDDDAQSTQNWIARPPVTAYAFYLLSNARLHSDQRPPSLHRQLDNKPLNIIHLEEKFYVGYCYSPLDLENSARL